MKSWIAAIVLALASLPVFGAGPTDASLERLLAVTRSESLIDSMQGQVEQMFRQSMAQGMKTAGPGGKLNDAQQRIVDELPGRFAALMREEMSWTRFKPMMMTVYRESFSQEEIDGLIAFYESPLGKLMIERMPVVMQRSMELVQADMKTTLPKLEALMKDTMRRLQEAR